MLLHLGLLRTNVDSFLPYTRPISPQLSSIMLFLGLWMIYRVVNLKTNFKFVVGLGILSGLSLYLYIYTWTFLSAVLGLYLIYFLAQKNREKIKLFFTALLVNGIIALPFLFNLLKARSDPDYVYSTGRLGLVHSHMPIVGTWIIMGFLALIFLWPARHKSVKSFLLFLFTALAIVLNQQIVTGFKLQPGHFHWFYTKPFIAIIITLIIVHWLETMVSKKWVIAVGMLLGSIFFFNGGIIQAHSYIVNYPTFQDNQRYAPVLAFLDRAYSDEKNIWAHTDLSALIVASTHHQAYLPDEYSYSYDYVRDNLFLEYRLKGISDKNIMTVMMRDKGSITSRLFGLSYRDRPGNHERTDADLARDVMDYKIFYATPLDQILKKLNIDLMVTDAGDDIVRLEKLPFLSKIFITGRISVYQLTVK